jgi:4-carboxymuconolactone decarboxylase
MAKSRREKGIEKMNQVLGKGGDIVINKLKEIAPDFGDMIIEFAYGDIYNRPGLDMKSREIASVAALTVMGNVIPQLKVHIQGALNVGCSETEIVEVIMQMSAYGGFPAALNAMFAAKEVFSKNKK